MSANDPSYQRADLWSILLLSFSKKLTSTEEEVLMYQGLVALSLQQTHSNAFDYIATLPNDKLNLIVEICQTFSSFIAHEHNPTLPSYSMVPSPIVIANDLCVIDPSLPIPEGSFIHIEAGTAFGTGQHPSTQLLLNWIHHHNFQNLNVCDVGCGSGILGIYAKMRGASSVLCVDIDPEALDRTSHHAKLNNVSVQIETTIDPHAQFDIIVSNCESKVLLELYPEIINALKPGGLWIITGIITRIWKSLQTTLPSWPIIEEDKQKGWVLKCLQKPI